MRRTALELWPRQAKVIEFGLRDGRLGEYLSERGFRYLGVVDSDPQAQRIGARHGRLAGRLAVQRGGDRIRQNNADVLILSGGASAAMHRYRNFRHAKFVACPSQNGPLTLWTLLFWLPHFLLLRLTWPRLVTIGKQRLLSFRVRRPKPYSAARQFIPHALGIAGFFQQLQCTGVRHAVLRWFESLPAIAPGEDLDLLVDDEALPLVRQLLTRGPGLQAVDLYSVCGAPGADYRKLPYYAPFVAEQILERAVSHRGLCHVPALRDHFLSLAYHALYHKGLSSGLPLNAQTEPLARRPEHNYTTILGQMSRELGIDVPITLVDLDAYIDQVGWRPPHDMLLRLARKNKWLRTLVQQAADDPADAGLAVFLLRRKALERGGVARATRLIEQQGFKIVETISITADRSDAVAHSIRGGNWGAGPWPISGGPPVAAIVVHDQAPLRPSRQELRRFPCLANARLLRKDALRDMFNDGHPAAEHCNVIHSSDNGREARDYLRIIAPQRMDEILSRARSLHSGAVGKAA